MNSLSRPQKRCEATSSNMSYHCLQASLLNAVLLLLVPLLSGCATPALWKHTAAHEWRPASSPDQILTATTTGRQDVIVVFHQVTSVGDETKHRLVAWNLCQSPSGLTVGRRALRQLTNACDRVQVMPLFPSDTVPPNASSITPGYAVTGPQQSQFMVHLDAVPPGPFDLPWTKQESRLLRRAAILPLAVAADAVIVSAVCCAGAGYGGPGPIGR